MHPSGSENGVTFKPEISRCTPSSASPTSADDLSGCKTCPRHFVGIDQENVARAFDSAQTVAETIDGRIELVVAAHGDQAIPPRRVGETTGRQRSVGTVNSAFPLSVFQMRSRALLPL